MAFIPTLGVDSDLGSIPEDLKFRVARSYAIESYAAVEQSLGDLFSSLLGTRPELGAIAFFRITSTSQRNAIIEELITKVHGDKYRLYWKGAKNAPGLLTLIIQLDQHRNQVVHWRVMADVDLNGRSTALKLVKGNMWAFRPGAETVTVNNIMDFCIKADFVSRSINVFNWHTNRQYPIPDAERAPWLRIFEQVPAFPLPDTHPLSPNYGKPESPPQSSPP